MDPVKLKAADAATDALFMANLLTCLAAGVTRMGQVKMGLPRTEATDEQLKETVLLLSATQRCFNEQVEELKQLVLEQYKPVVEQHREEIEAIT